MPDLPKPVAHSEFEGLIGAARTDITPPIGIFARNWGAAEHDTASGIHRPLTATALTLQVNPDDPPFVLLALDLGWWRSAADEWFVRGGLIEALSLDPARVLINLAHTHSGPSICPEDADKPGGAFIAPYLTHVRDRVISAARQALVSRQAATLSWTYGKCDIACNRDLRDPDGSRFICSFNPTGPADDTILIGRVTSDAGAIIGTLVNYACHPVTLGWENSLISPDFVGAMRETVESDTERAPCLFLQGASGELAPREQYFADPSIADAHGRKLGFAALSVLADMLPPRTLLEYDGVTESGAPLGCWRRTPRAAPSLLRAYQTQVELQLKDMPTAAEIGDQILQSKDRAMAERLRRLQRVRKSVGDGSTAKIPLWAWRIGDALLVAQPNEAYSLLQTELRNAFADREVCVMNITNGWHGYLPPKDLYNEDIYPVWQTPFDRGGLERVIEESKQAIADLMDEG